MLPREQRGGRPDSRVTLATTITIQLNTGKHPNIIYTYNTNMLCFGVVAGADIVTTCTSPAPRQSITLVMNLVSFNNLI